MILFLHFKHFCGYNRRWLLLAGILLLALVLIFSPGARTASVHKPWSYVASDLAVEKESMAACPQVQYRARESQMIEEDAPSLTPPNPAGATLVDLGLYINNIVAIQEVENTFQIEGFLESVWCDPRLAFPPDDVGEAPKVYLEANALALLERIWHPDLSFVNEVGGRSIENEELLVFAGGTVQYEEKFSVILATNFDLLKFPFDTQQLLVEIESFAWDANFLQFHIEERKVGFREEFELPTWQIQRVETAVVEVREVRDRAPFSEFRMTITVLRRYGYHLWKVLVPLALLVCISWAVFWMERDDLASRLGVAFTGILTVVAYQFVVTSGLPPVSYFTLTDSIITFSFVLMLLTVLENIYVNILLKQESEAAAERLDYFSRRGFPLLYGGGLIILFATYLLR